MYIYPYLSASDNKINLAPISTHQGGELLAHTLQNPQSVVLGKSLQEVLNGVILAGYTSNLLQFLDDLRLIASGQGRGAQDGGELCILLEHFREGRERLGGLF